MTLVVVALVAVLVVPSVCNCPDEDLENFGAAARVFVRAAPADKKLSTKSRPQPKKTQCASGTFCFFWAGAMI